MSYRKTSRCPRDSSGRLFAWLRKRPLRHQRPAWPTQGSRPSYNKRIASCLARVRARAQWPWIETPPSSCLSLGIPTMWGGNRCRRRPSRRGGGAKLVPKFNDVNAHLTNKSNLSSVDRIIHEARQKAHPRFGSTAFFADIVFPFPEKFIQQIQQSLHVFPRWLRNFFSDESSWTPKTQANYSRAAVWLSFWCSTVSAETGTD